MKNKGLFIKILKESLGNWGGGPPPEAVWTFNNLLGWLQDEYEITIDIWLDEDLNNVKECLESINKKIRQL
jgi:hypothetical protein